MKDHLERRWVSGGRRRLIRALGEAADALESSIEDGDPVAATEWAVLLGELRRALRIRDLGVAERSRLSDRRLHPNTPRRAA